MSEQPDHPTEPLDDSTTAPPPPAALRGYPPEADPAADDVTAPVEVPGEQTDPTHRRHVFGEDDQRGR